MITKHKLIEELKTINANGDNSIYYDEQTDLIIGPNGSVSMDDFYNHYKRKMVKILSVSVTCMFLA